MSLFKRGPNRLERLLAASRLQEAMGRVQPIPAGARIYTSDSPKVEVAHLKSALHPGAVCEAMSQRTGPWLGTGSNEEREWAAALWLCGRCALGEGKAAP